MMSQRGLHRCVGSLLLALNVALAGTQPACGGESENGLTIRMLPETGAIEILDRATPVLRYQDQIVSEPAGLRERLAPASRQYAVPRCDYIHPLYGLAGEVLTEDWSADHPHHRGLYWAWPEVDWRGKRGDLHALQHVLARPAEKARAVSEKHTVAIQAKHTWQWEDGTPIVLEEATIRVHRRTEPGRAIDLALRFTALGDDVQVARRGTNGYGGLNLRLTKLQNLKMSVLTDPPGTQPRGAWAHLTGVPPKSPSAIGLTILQSADNPEYPGDWVQKPYLPWLQPTFPTSGTRFAIGKNRPLELHYRLWIHDKTVTPETFRALCAQYQTSFLRAIVPTAHADDLNLPSEKITEGKPEEMMRRYFLRDVERAAGQWKADYEKRKTADDIAAYQKRLREWLLQSLGGLPERTPLESQTIGTVLRPGYRVEKVLFQSQPKHYVSAILFLPETQRFKPPYPGVLIPCGHSPISKGYPPYQTMGALLALHGMAALVYDPIDQGERGQHRGKDGQWHPMTTAGHSMVGVGCILLGRNTARFESWDGMRAIDYLQSRPEVDPQRIGCTGNSGGGTQTGYLMALDDRIRAAAPSCWLMGIPKLLATIGAQDAEQNLFGQLAFGADHADLVMARAPSPVLLCAATKDFFDISGTWDLFRYAKRLYTRMGFAERVDLLENDAGHNYDILPREGAARWMSRWLLGKDQVITEPQITLLTEKEYQCTPTGFVMSLPGARSVYDLNEEYEHELASRRAAAWTPGSSIAMREQVRRLTSIRKLTDLPFPEVNSFQTISRPGYTIERLLIRPEPAIALPALWFMPEQPKPHQEPVLYVHQYGKAAGAEPDGPIERLVQAGHPVLAVDLRGTGQTQSPNGGGSYYTREFQDVYMAYLLGRSYVGMRAEDVLICARYVVQRVAGGASGTVQLITVGNVGIPALHAAALEPSLFSTVKNSRRLLSWSRLVHDRSNERQMPNVVHGALGYYDLPNLETILGKKLIVDNPVDAMNAVIPQQN